MVYKVTYKITLNEQEVTRVEYFDVYADIELVRHSLERQGATNISINKVPVSEIR